MLALRADEGLSLLPSILLRSVPDEDFYYAFDVASGDHFQLNRTSYWILEAIGVGVQWGQLVAQFLANFDVDQTQAEDDLQCTIELLLDENVIRKVSDGDQA